MFKFSCYVVDDVIKTHADLLCHIVDDNDAMSSSVVAGGDGSKPLLTCCVPLGKNTHTDDVPLSRDSASTLSLHDTWTFILYRSKFPPHHPTDSS